MSRHHAWVLAALLGGGCVTAPANKTNEPRLPAGISFKESLNTYRVTGADRVQVGASIRSGPSQEDGYRYSGYYKWNLNWRYGWESSGQLCSVVRVTIDIKAVVTLPEWAAPPGVEPALVEEWRSFANALAEHEGGHRELVRAGAIRMQRALRDIPAQDCTGIEGALQTAAQSLLSQIRAEDARYDETTRHGATQGVTWAGMNRSAATDEMAITDDVDAARQIAE